MNWIDHKYASFLGSTLSGFVRKKEGLWNFRCPLCGDSGQSKRKKRGYLIADHEKLRFYCHNGCGSMPFSMFLQRVSLPLHQQYIVERFGSSAINKPKLEKPKHIVVVNDPLKAAIKVSSLPPFHPCKKYVISRQIPTTRHHKLFYADKFADWVNTFITDKDKQLNPQKANEPRLIIPLCDNQNKMFGFQGRSLDPADKLRYITIMLDGSKPKVYGLDTVDFNQRFYVVEGPIDCMFLSNAIATLGGVIDQVIEPLDFDRSNAVLVYDNQPRNKQVVKNVLRAARKGYKVVIWPESFGEKDINEYITDNIKGDYVKTERVLKLAASLEGMMEDHTYRGLAAELAIADWKKC